MAHSGHSDDTIDIPQVDTDGDDDGNKKVCCQCGKDLRGHRRFKDSIGYWCKNCHRTDKQRHVVPEGRCPDCGRMRPLDKLYQMEDGTQICSACRKERQVLSEKHAIKYAAENAIKSEERRKIYIGIAIITILVLVVIIQQIAKWLR